MSHSNAHRLARARDILMGAHMTMGIAHSDAALHDIVKTDKDSPSRGIYSIVGSQGEFNDALARCAHPRSWIAVVGLPEIGWQKLSERGVCLERVVVIPALDLAQERVLYALASVMDILCIGDISLNTTSRKRIAAKARQKNCTILTQSLWTGLSRPFPQEKHSAEPLPLRRQEAVGI